MISQKHGNYPLCYRLVSYVYYKESRCWELLLYVAKWELPKDKATEPGRKRTERKGDRSEVGGQEGMGTVPVLQSVQGTL